MKRTILLIAILLVCGLLMAQSRLTYIGMSALLPGSGELAMGKTNRGIVMIAADLLAAYSYFKTDNEIDLQRDQYRKYAYVYAGVSEDMPLNHYQYVQEYISSEDYNDYLEMIARNYYLISNYDPEGYADFLQSESFSSEEMWAWQSAAHWEKYKDMRKTHQKTKINHTLSIGLLLLNRAISVVDTAILSRNLQLYARPSGMDGLMLNCELRF